MGSGGGRGLLWAAQGRGCSVLRVASGQAEGSFRARSLGCALSSGAARRGLPLVGSRVAVGRRLKWAASCLCGGSESVRASVARGCGGACLG